MTFDSADMALRGRIGGYSRAAKYSPEELTGPARVGFMRRFMPNESGLSEEECQRRVQAGLKAHMHRLARLSALSRQKHNPRETNGSNGNGKSVQARTTNDL